MTEAIILTSTVLIIYQSQLNVGFGKWRSIYISYAKNVSASNALRKTWATERPRHEKAWIILPILSEFA